jgi:hypothetical protein
MFSNRSGGVIQDRRTVELTRTSRGKALQILAAGADTASVGISK